MLEERLFLVFGNDLQDLLTGPVCSFMTISLASLSLLVRMSHTYKTVGLCKGTSIHYEAPASQKAGR